MAAMPVLSRPLSFVSSVDLARELRFAVRSLARNPGFTGAAVLTLAVGIGAATAISTVVEAVLLRPLPFPDSDRLVNVVENDRPRSLPRLNYHEYLEWRSRTTTLSGMAVATLDPQMTMPTPAGMARLTGGLVSTNYFEVLGLHARLGRTLESRDEADPGVAVLSFETWQRYFGGDPGVLGMVVENRSGTIRDNGRFVSLLTPSLRTALTTEALPWTRTTRRTKGKRPLPTRWAAR